jgi:hypothetical protein
VAAMATLCRAESFDPVFRVLRLSGECQISTPDSPAFVPVQPGKAYPYASTVRTGKKSSVIIALSANNECRLKDKTSIFLPDPGDSRETRVIRLSSGQVQVDLDPNAKTPNEVTVDALVASASARTSRFSAQTRLTNDQTEATFTCESGTLRVTGPQFDIPTLKPTDSVEVSGTGDQTYSRLHVLRGVIPVGIRDMFGNPTVYEAKLHSVLKFWMKRSDADKATSVVLRILDAGGETERIKQEDGVEREMAYPYRVVDAPEAK